MTRVHSGEKACRRHAILVTPDKRSTVWGVAVWGYGDQTDIRRPDRPDCVPEVRYNPTLRAVAR